MAAEWAGRKGRPWRRLRLQILEAYGWRCVYCGQRATEVDHVQAISDGGHPTDPANLRASCGPCNRRKGAGVAPEATDRRSRQW